MCLKLTKSEQSEQPINIFFFFYFTLSPYLLTDESYESLIRYIVLFPFNFFLLLVLKLFPMKSSLRVDNDYKTTKKLLLLIFFFVNKYVGRYFMFFIHAFMSKPLMLESWHVCRRYPNNISKYTAMSSWGLINSWFF